jgi:hypothetical protein
LRSKGVESVRQHVTTLNRHISISIEELISHLKTVLCDSAVVLTAGDVAAIEDMEQEYLSDAFIYGNNPAATLVKEERIEGVGEFRVSLEVKAGRIRSVSLSGDFFIIGDIDSMLLSRLKGVERTALAIEDALAGVDVPSVIMNLKKEQLINLIL